MAVAIVLLSMNRPPSAPAAPSTSAATNTSMVSSPLAQPTDTAALSPTPAADTPTFFVITPSPAITSTSPATGTPSLPIAVQAMVQGSMTPVFPVEIGRLQFATEIDKYRLLARR